MTHKQKILIVIAFICSWLIPGGGFFVLKRPLKGVVFFFMVAGLVTIGLFLSDFREIRMQDNPFYYLGKFGSGLIYLVCYLFMSYSPHGWVSIKYSEIGLLYICVAGALNLVVLMGLLSSANKYFTEIPAPGVPDGT
jgi:hypothetical protein